MDFDFLLYRKIRSYIVKNFCYVAVQIFKKCTWLKKLNCFVHPLVEQCGEAAFLNMWWKTGGILCIILKEIW